MEWIFEGFSAFSGKISGFSKDFRVRNRFLKDFEMIFEIYKWIFEGFSAFFGEISIYLDFAIRFLKTFRQFLGKFIT